MVLGLVDLDERTRTEMQAELADDVEAGRLYRSGRLSDIGWRDYPVLISEAAARHDDAWLAAELRLSGRLNSWEESHTRTGRVISKRVPVDAADTLAEGEFNRLYLRGLCRRALADGIAFVEIYRAKEVASPRAESLILVGQLRGAADLLSDLRANVGVDTALRLPPGPNSGLSARLHAASAS